MKLNNGSSPFDGVSSEKIELYRSLVIAEMETLGATATEIALITHETILNAIKNNRDPGNVAWAILQ